MAATVLDTVLLNLGIDNAAQQSWIKLGANVKDTAATIYKNFGGDKGVWAQMGNVFQKFGDSGVRSFGNLSTFAEKLSGRIKSISTDFTATNIAMQAAAAGGDLLNLRWAEMGNTAKRWVELAGLPVIQTLAKLYIGYRLLAHVVGTAINSWQRAGAAMADAVQMNDKVGESVARLTGNLDGLSHRYVKLADARLYATAGKDLSSFGELMQELGIASRLTGVMMESFLIKVVTWPAKFKIVGDAVGYLSNVLKDSNKAWLKWMEPEGYQESFRVKLIKNEAKAIESFKNNLQAWSAESGLAPEEITESWERMGRVLGDTTTATEMLTVAMGNIKARGNVAPKETLAIFEKLTQGIRPTTEELRAFGVEINTTKNGLNTFAGIFDLIINKMQASATTFEQIQFAEKLQKNTHIKLAVMRSDFEDFMAYEKTFTNSMIADSNKLAKANFKNEEDRRAAFALDKQLMDESYTQLVRVINLVKAQTGLEDAVFGVGITDRFVASFKELDALQKHASEVITATHGQAGRELMAQVREGYAQLYSSIETQGKSFLDMQQTSIESANKLVRTMGSFSKGTDVRQMGAYIDGMNERSVKAFKQRFDFEANIFKKSQETGVKQVALAESIINSAQRHRDYMIGTIQAGVAATGEARRGIIEVYDIEGAAISTNFSKKMTAYKAEIALARYMQTQTKADANEKVGWLNKEVGARKAILDMAKQSISVASGGGAFKSPAQAAIERAANNFAGEAAKILATGKTLSPLLQDQIGRMSSAYQEVLQMEAQRGEALRYHNEIMKEEAPLWEKSKGVMGAYIELLGKSMLSFEQRNIALQYRKASGQEAGAMQYVAKTGGASVKDQIEDFQKVVDDLTETTKLTISNTQKQEVRLRDFDEKQKAILDEALKVIEAGAANDTKFQEFITSLEAAYKIIVADFGGPAGIMKDGVTIFKGSVDQIKKEVDKRFGKMEEKINSEAFGPHSPTLDSEETNALRETMQTDYTAFLKALNDVQKNPDMTQLEKIDKTNFILQKMEILLSNTPKAVEHYTRYANVENVPQATDVYKQTLRDIQIDQKLTQSEVQDKLLEIKNKLEAAGSNKGSQLSNYIDMLKSVENIKNPYEKAEKGGEVLDKLEKYLSNLESMVAEPEIKVSVEELRKSTEDMTSATLDLSGMMRRVVLNAEKPGGTDKKWLERSPAQITQLPRIQGYDMTALNEKALAEITLANEKQYSRFADALVAAFKFQEENKPGPEISNWRDFPVDKLAIEFKNLFKGVDPAKLMEQLSIAFKEQYTSPSDIPIAKLQDWLTSVLDKIRKTIVPSSSADLESLSLASPEIKTPEIKQRELPELPNTQNTKNIYNPYSYPPELDRKPIVIKEDVIKPGQVIIAEKPKIPDPMDFELPSFKFADKPEITEVPKIITNESMEAMKKQRHYEELTATKPLKELDKKDMLIIPEVKKEGNIDGVVAAIEGAAQAVNPIVSILKTIAEGISVLVEKTKEGNKPKGDSVALQVLNSPDTALKKLLGAFQFRESRSK